MSYKIRALSHDYAGNVFLINVYLSVNLWTTEQQNIQHRQ